MGDRGCVGEGCAAELVDVGWERQRELGTGNRRSGIGNRGTENRDLGTASGVPSVASRLATGDMTIQPSRMFPYANARPRTCVVRAARTRPRVALSASGR